MKTLHRFLIAFLSISMIWSCGPQQTTETEEVTVEKNEPSLTFLWETPDVLTTCESAYYDKNTGNIYVSNITSMSIISNLGEVINEGWITGLDGPKGIGMSNGKLFVTNIDELLEIDVAAGTVEKRHEVEGAVFLNDVATYGDKIYFSDMHKGNIHVLENGTISTFSTLQVNINGLEVGKNGTLYGLDDAGLKKYNEDGTFELININVRGGDGLIILDEENNVFLASQWVGKVYLIEGSTETLLLDTEAEGTNAADLGFIRDKNIVLVPTFSKNKVVAYQLNY